MKKKISIAIFGSSSTLGSELSKFLISKKFIVKNITRSNDKNDLTYSIGKDFNPEILNELDKIIFVAHDFKNQNYKFVGNGIKKLFEKCREKNIDILYISSTAANETSKSVYGKSKYYAEQIVYNFNGIVIIPGLIFGKNIKAGLIPKIKKISQISLFIPYVSGFKNDFYITDINYFLEAIEKIVLNENVGRFLCAYYRSLSFSDLVSIFSKRKIYIKIPFSYHFVKGIFLIFVKLNVLPKKYLDSLYNLEVQRDYKDVSKIYVSKKL